MITPGDDKLDKPEPALPSGARVALQRGGVRLLEELASLREEEAARVEIGPLDPQATLALRRQGGGLLARLAAQRSEKAAHLRRRRRRHRAAIAAALIGLIGSAWLIGSAYFTPGSADPSQAITSAGQTPAHGQSAPTSDPLPSPAIPEPNSALLALVGGIVLLGQRRRPY